MTSAGKFGAPRGRVVVLGSANIDVILGVGAFPAAGETVLGGDAVLHPGGKGANQAVAAALAGASVLFAGCVGDDVHGASVRAALAAAGVNDDLLRTARGRSTGLAFVLVRPDGENAIAVSPGANHALDAGDVEPLRAELNTSDVLLMQMELPPDVVVAGVDIARDTGASVVLNLAPATAVASAVLRGVAVLVVNQSEAEFLLGYDLPDPSALRAGVAELRKLGPAAAVLTAGAGGAFVGDADGVLHVSAVAVDVVDTSGAGDAFAGVLAAHLSRGIPLRTAVHAATEAGAVAVQSHGAQLRSLDLEHVDEQVGGT